MRSMSSAGAFVGLALATLPTSSVAQARARPVAAAVAADSLADSLRGSAKAEYDAARLLAADGDFAGAAVKFRRAWELVKDPRLLWNIAACEKNLRHYAKALQLIETYASEGGSRLSEQERKEARDAIETLRSFVSHMTVDADLAGAEVFVDGEPVGTPPLGRSVLVDIGRHRVVVQRDGYRPFATTVEASGASELRVDAKLKRDAPAAPTIARDDASSHRTLGIALGATGVALGAFGAFAITRAHASEQESRDAIAARDQVGGDDAYHRAELWQATWVGAFIAGGAAAATGAYFLLSAGDGNGTGAVRVMPVAGAGALGASVGGAW